MLEADPNRKGMWRAILMDFGLVLRANNTMTTGSAFGTPRYIAPEQALSSADANPRSDIYSLGVMVYEMLAGRPPFEDDDTPIGVALSHVTKPPPDPQTIRSDLPDAVVPVLMKVLEKEPEKRYQSATEFIEAVAKSLGLTSKGVALSESERTLMQAELPAKPKEVVAHPLTPVAIPAPIPRPGPTEASTQPPPRQSRRWLPIAAGLVVLAGVALVALLALSGGGDSSGNDEQPIVDDSSDAGGQSEVPEEGPPASREGRLELSYANDLLLIRNGSNDALDLRGMSFRQGEQQFSLADFGRSTLARWPIGQCAYIQVLNHTADPIESNCAAEQFTLPLEYVNANQFVWSGDEAFEVRQDGETLATCSPSEGSCIIQGVKQARN
jgi:serine/threonine protein kinase